MEKQRQLDQIATDIIERNVCPDLAKDALHLVMGAGNPDAEVMFIGEAPGKREDETGLPFVGASGKLLDELLESVDMTRDDVFITSIVKYRPPKNRDPKPDEKAAFLPYLLRQIDVIDPKVIVPLGKHGMEFFLPGVRISDVHGQPHPTTLGERNVTILPLYHPAYALYGGTSRDRLMADIAILKTLVE